MSDFVAVGRVRSAYGVFGWLKIHSFTEPDIAILDLNPWFIKKHDSYVELNIEATKIQGNGFLVKFFNCETPEAAKKFSNAVLFVKRSQLPKLPKGEYYRSELVGLVIVNKSGDNFGVVKQVLVTGANDVLVVSGEQRRLIPYISSVVLKVDLAQKQITVDWQSDY